MPSANSIATWLDVWEHSLAEPAWLRPLLWLAVDNPELSTEESANWSIGRRDAALLRLREAAFGSQLTCLEICPNCHERLELSFQTNDLTAADEPEIGGETQSSEAELEVDGWTVRFRLPNSLDLAAISALQDETAARQALLQRCILAVVSPGKSETMSLPPAGLLQAIDQAVTQAMDQMDAEAISSLALTCPICEHAWEAAFDIGQYFWIELDDWARRMLRQVHSLAMAYGWSEADILSLSPARRIFYLSLIAGR